VNLDGLSSEILLPVANHGGNAPVMTSSDCQDGCALRERTARPLNCVWLPVLLHHLSFLLTSSSFLRNRTSFACSRLEHLLQAWLHNQLTVCKEGGEAASSSSCPQQHSPSSSSLVLPGLTAKLIKLPVKSYTLFLRSWLVFLQRQ